IKLPGETDGEVADIDHLLHFAEALGHDLARLERDHLGEHRLCFADLLAEQSHELAPHRRRDDTPAGERLHRVGAGAVGIAYRDVADGRSVDRRMTDESAGVVDPEQLEELCGVFRGAHASISLARAIAATPSWIVSSFLPKHSRTRWRGGSFSANADRGTNATPAVVTAAVAKLSSSSSRPEAARSTHRKVGKECR